MLPTDVICSIGNLLGVPAQEEIKVWTQMFFDDGSITQGRYLPCSIIDNKTALENIARHFLKDTNRTEGVLMVWGAGAIIVKKARLLLLKRGETLRLRDF